jgi:hypothetical protein
MPKTTKHQKLIIVIVGVLALEFGFSLVAGWNWINLNGGAITALATIAIAIFTYTLWKTNSGQLEIIKKQTDAMIAAESPHLFLGGLKLVKYDGSEGDSIEDPVSGSVDGYIRPLVLVKNGGRSPMRISKTSINWYLGKDLPNSPTYKRIGGSIILLEPSKDTWLIDLGCGFELGDSQIEKIQKGKAYLWIFGFVSHLNHLTNETITLGFVGRWDPHAGQFIGQGPQQYTYERRSAE